MRVADVGKNAVSVADPVIELLDDAPKLVDYISNAIGLSPVEVARGLQREQQSLGSTVYAEIQRLNIRPYEWQEALNDFYSQTNAFMFESIVWNQGSLKRGMRRWIANYLTQNVDPTSRVLVFGDGQGFDSYYIARLGYPVDYFEVSQKSLGFARRMFAEYQCPVEVRSATDEVKSRQYDVVVCLDVFEHVQEPGGLVSLLASLLRPGGVLIAHAPFWYLAPAVATHLRSNRKYSGDTKRLYQPYGLRPVDGALFWNPLVLEKTAVLAETATSPASITFRKRLWLGLGSWLLWVGRYWSLPHRLVLWMLAADDRRPWKEVDAFLQTQTKPHASSSQND